MELDVNDKLLIDKFFNVNGFVLDFTTSLFDAFCFDSVGIKLCEKYIFNMFLGILFSAPLMRTDGTITIQNIPTNQIAVATTPIMINLGYYIKSYELDFFKNYYEKFSTPPLPEKE